MSAHLMTDAARFSDVRPRLAGPNYRGLHRAASAQQLVQPGALVLEPASQNFSSVMRLIDADTALVRHVGTFDDHPVALAALRPAGSRVRIGTDFGDRD
jgi:hypothetical protein